MRILFVCTANICRSASAEWLLREAIAADPALTGIEVRSAGTHAIDGAPGCSMAPALVEHATEHRSTQLTAELIAWADLILAAARDHRSAVVRLDPAARARTFTIRQAGRICEWMLEAGIVEAGRQRAVATATRTAVGWADLFEPGDPRADVPALPDDLGDRWRWWVGELDAARTMTPAPEASGATDVLGAGNSRSWFRWPRAERPALMRGTAADEIADTDDVPDPHVLGAELHAVAYGQLRQATVQVARLLHEMTT